MFGRSPPKLHTLGGFSPNWSRLKGPAKTKLRFIRLGDIGESSGKIQYFFESWHQANLREKHCRDAICELVFAVRHEFKLALF